MDLYCSHNSVEPLWSSHPPHVVSVPSRVLLNTIYSVRITPWGVAWYELLATTCMNKFIASHLGYNYAGTCTPDYQHAQSALRPRITILLLTNSCTCFLVTHYHVPLQNLQPLMQTLSGKCVVWIYTAHIIVQNPMWSSLMLCLHPAQFCLYYALILLSLFLLCITLSAIYVRISVSLWNVCMLCCLLGGLHISLFLYTCS